MASAILGGGAAYATMRGRRAHATSRAFAAAAIVLCALLTASVGFNIYQYVDHSNERQARLEDTLLRQARTPGGLPSDPEVKELSYAQQTKHADAMSTAQAESLLEAAERGESKDVVFLDVRERAEREMGTLRGVTFVRYPDFAASGLNLKGKQAVLFCHNGNRSHETCEALKKQGIDCRFIVGGVEKWVTEGRAMEGLQTRSLYQLRAIPEYRNRNTLLDTHEVRRLVAEEKAIFVDARYPFEFENNGRLPNAINFTIRRTPTADLQKHIDALPKQPIILPCYDRRTCFFSEVLGLELTRAGLDVRGRYTQPWAYFVQSPRPPHVEQWIAENNRSIWAKSASHLANFLAWLSQWTGLILVIVLLAAVSRLLVLPFSLKAERDQIRSRATGSELDVIKRDLKDDPVRRTRAIWGFYKRHNLTPMRNLLALLFLPVMAVALLAVQEMSEKSDIALLWMPSIAQRDPWFILPLVFGVLITLYSDLAFATNAKHRIVIWLTVLPLMSATGALFSAGPNLYLIASAALLLVQRLWVDGSMARAMQQLRRSRLPMGVIALEDVSKLADYGNKAHRLAQMRAAGMPIPDGLLLTPDFLKSFADSSTQQQTKLLDRLWNRLGRHHLAVRSSANGEDSASQSFAGVFESVLDVDRAGLSKAIATVQGSYKAARVGSYASNTGDGSVLMQRMVHAQYSGVLFTRDPSAGGLAMVEMVQGTAENLVSGLVRPQTYRFGRLTKKSFSHEDPQIDLAPLLALGDQAEVLFGGPQDIEWTYRDGQFYLVQCRDITRSIAGDAVEAALQQDIARVVEIAKGAAADEIIFEKNELSEMLPRPTPLSLSLMESLWASGGSVDRAARELQLTYQVEEGSEYFATILGRLYVDKREEKSRALVLPSRAIKRLFRQADKIERDFHEIFLPEFLGSARLVSVADFEKLSADELVSDIGRLRDRFVNDTHVAVDVINIAASIYLDRARAALVAAKIDPSDVLGHIPETIESRSIMEIAATRDKSRQKFLMLGNFGHRAVFEYELAGPRFSENPDALGRLIAGREPTTHKSDRESPKLAKSLARMIDVARRFQTLKEDAKHHSLRELATLRRAVLCLDRRFGLEGASFYLSFDELLTLNAQNAAVLRVIANNRQEHAALLRKSSSLPAKLRSHDLEAASAGELVQAQASTDAIRGTRVAGSKVVEARAWVISDDDSEQAKSMEGFHDGDIIVSVMINPAWLPYFSRAGGFVSEVGGWLSHPAILAREYDVAMIVGVDGLSRISDGSLLRLQLDGSIVIVAEGRKVEEVQAA